MNCSEASVVASELGPDPMGGRLRARGSAAEIEHRVDRARQIVARQRELVERVGERIPGAVTLLKTFESTLGLIEKTQTALQRSRALRAEAEQAVQGTVTAALPSDCPEPGDPIHAKLDYEKQMSAVARIMEILREGGYRCEFDCATLH